MTEGHPDGNLIQTRDESRKKKNNQESERKWDETDNKTDIQEVENKQRQADKGNTEEVDTDTYR